MSTISKTSYYELTKYEGVDKPKFLGDISNDHQKIDNALHSINQRMQAVEEVIDTVSTQNIDDMLARLGALEVKVDANANSIRGLSDSINGLSTRVTNNTNNIASLGATLTDAQRDIENLKQCCDEVRTVLVQYGDRISGNETAIANINNQLTRMNEDIIGNAQDITTVATQINTLIESKQDKLIEGTGIKIEDNVISVDGAGNVVGTYDSSTENLTLG